MANEYAVSNKEAFESLGRIMQETYDLDYGAKTMEKDGFPILSDGHHARGYFLTQPMMIMASTGSGKTLCMVLPYLISCLKAGNSIVCNDPKGDMWKYTKTMAEDLGYNIVVLDMRNPQNGDRYNLWKYPAQLYKEGKKGRADQLFQTTTYTCIKDVESTKDAFWHHTSGNYIAGIAAMCADIFEPDEVTINNVYEVHLQGNKRFGSSTYLKTYLDNHSDKPYYKLIHPFITAASETRASLDAVLTSSIAKMCRNEDIVDQTTNSTFNITDLVEKKTIIYIISRDESAVYNSLISSYVGQLFEMAIDLAEEKYNGCLKRRLSFILDEFGNLAPLENINAMITSSRSRNIGWCLCCQSLDQLNLKYGAEIAKIIMGNCSIAYMYSSDLNLLKMLSELCGKITNEYTGETRPVFSVEDLRQLDKKSGETLFLLERMKPFVGHLSFISDYDIKPLEKVEITKRDRQNIKPINYIDFVENEKRAELRKKMEAFDEFDKLTVDQGSKIFVVIKSMKSPEKTAEIAAKILEVSPAECKKYLEKKTANGDHVIKVSSAAKAHTLIRLFKEIGTIAEIKEIPITG